MKNIILVASILFILSLMHTFSDFLLAQTPGVWHTYGPSIPGYSPKIFTNPINNNIIYAVSDTVYQSDDFGLTWKYADPPFNENLINILQINDMLIACNSHEIYESSNGGITWTIIKLPLNEITIKTIKIVNNMIYIGTEKNGIFRSSNRGFTWTQANAPLNDKSIYSITSGMGVMYACTGEIFKSEDEGINWTKMNKPVDASITSTYISNDTIYTEAGWDGIFRSIDGGINWTNISPQKLPGSIRASDISIIDGRIFAGIICLEYPGHPMYLGLYMSNDGGENYKNVIGNVKVNEIVYYDGIIYVGTLNKPSHWVFTEPSDGIFLSSDFGNTWIQANEPIKDKEIFSVVSIGKRIFAGTNHGIYRSVDKGINWIKSSLPPNTNCCKLIINKDIIFTYSDPRVLDTANQSDSLKVGVFRSVDGGFEWSHVFKYTVDDILMFENQIYAATLAVPDPEWSNKYQFFGGVFKTTDMGKEWDECLYTYDTPGISSFHQNISNLFLIVKKLFVSCSNYTYISNDEGRNWIQINLPFNSKITAMAFLDGNIFAGTENSGIFLSTDQGFTWLQTNSSVNDKTITCLVSFNQTVFAGTEHSGIYWSNDDGLTWEQANEPMNDKNVTAIISNDSLILSGTIPNGIFMSTDGGINWIQANSPLKDKSISNLVKIDNKIYAGTNDGVFWSTDGSNWNAINTGLDERRLNDLQYLEDLNRLYAATQNGIYFQTLDTSSPTAILLQINSNSAFTNNQNVELLLVSEGADSVIYGEDSSFINSRWRNYQVNKPFMLSNGDGLKSIYAKFKDISGNESEVISTKIILDTKKPIFLNHTTPTIATIGNPINIKQQVDEPNLQSMNLYYRRAGESWSVNRMVPFQSDSALIDGAFITNRGIDYRIIATDYAGHTDTLRNDNLTFFSIPVSIGIDTLGYSPGFPSGTGGAAYRIVSVPMKLNETSVAKSVLGISEKYGEKGNWRMWHYQGNEQWDEGENLPIRNGESYFLILRNGGTLTNKVAGTTMETTKGITGEIPGWYLRANDWTIIGNPYNTRIELSQLKLKRRNKLLIENNQDSSFQVWGYDGNWKNENLMLNPWDGLAIYVKEADTIVFANRNDPYARSLPKPKSTNSVSQEKLEDGEWIIQVIAQSQDYQDNVNYFGVRRNAKEELDKYDWYEPPMLPDGISANFPHPEWDNPVSLAADIRPNAEEGYKWKLNLRGNGRNVVTLNFQDLEKIPQKCDVILIDEETKIPRDLRIQTKISVRIPKETGLKSFIILAGKQEFINDHINGLGSIPTHFSLRQNYPNPFNSTTVIRYELPVSGKVSLKIYDLLGKEVMILENEQNHEPGYYEVVVNLSDFASGIYFIWISVRGEKQFESTKKMLFVK